MCVWPAEFPSIQPGLGNLPLPLSIPIPLPATVTFCAWSCPVPRHIPTHSKENKNEQLITRTDISNMWLSTCFFQVLGDFFPSWGRQELLRELPASHPLQHPTLASRPRQDLQHLSHKQQEYSCLPCSAPFPSSASALHQAGPLDTSRTTHSSGMLQGSHALFGFTSPGLWQIPAHCCSQQQLLGACPTGIFLHPEAQGSPRCCRRALPGRCCSCNLSPRRRRSGRWGGRSPQPAGPRRTRRNK